MRKFVLLGALLVLALALAGAVEFAPRSASASSHREAPLISQDPAADNTDVYFFRSPEAQDTVTIIANFYPYEGPAGGPNFYRFGDDVRYELNIDNNGDAKADIRYLFKFHTTIQNPNTFLYNTGPIDSINSSNLNVIQKYNLYKVAGGNVTRVRQGMAVAPSYVGCHSYRSNFAPTIPAQDCDAADANYNNLANSVVYDLPNGQGKVWAGQRRDSFFGDVGAIFDLLSIRGGFDSGGYNTFDKFGVQTIAMQIPISQLTRGSEPVVGVWAGTSRRATRVLPGGAPESLDESDINSSSWHQVSRLGLALVNEAVIPMSKKDMFNSTKPKDDAANYGAYVVNPELAVLLNALYGVDVPPTPRNDLVEALLKGVPNLNRPANSVPADVLRLNTTTAICTSGCSTLGVIGGDVQGYPNGRRLTDDVIDISERVIAGVLVNGFNKSPNNALGDGVNAPAGTISNSFPYLAIPVDGYSYVP